MINLLSKTGLGRSGHVRFQTFGPIWHVSGPKMVFWRNNLMILHHFCWRSSKIKLFWPKTLFWIRNVQNWTKSRDLDMSGPAKTCPGGQVLTANQRKYFYFFRFYTFPFFLTNLSYFLKIICFITKFTILCKIWKHKNISAGLQ